MPHSSLQEWRTITARQALLISLLNQHIIPFLYVLKVDLITVDQSITTTHGLCLLAGEISLPCIYLNKVHVHEVPLSSMKYISCIYNFLLQDPFPSSFVPMAPPGQDSGSRLCLRLSSSFKSAVHFLSSPLLHQRSQLVRIRGWTISRTWQIQHFISCSVGQHDFILLRSFFSSPEYLDTYSFV